MHPIKRASMLFILLAAAAGAAAASDAGRPAPGKAAAAADWPTWSGPRGDLTSPGHGAFQGDAFGLGRVWTRPLGPAYSGIVAAEGRLVTAFSDGEADVLVALDASTGAERWRYQISETYKGHDGSDDGPLSTPTVDGGVVYGLGARGGLFAVSLADGEELWRRDVVAEFGAAKPHYGFATTPTVVGDVLAVQVGGGDGRSVVAFDRVTGEMRWSAGDDRIGYQSPTVIELDGEPVLVAVTNRHLLGLAPATGDVLFEHRHTEGERGGFGTAQPVPVGR
ncbi:MAG: PQQ-binding-like beta-propeller repeat protein, partial [Acidobacteriota bacterium]